LHLTINATTSSSQTASVCSNQLPYTWNGLIFNTAGTQTKTGLTNSKDCDSSATLTLSVATASTPTISVVPSANNVCSGINVTFTATASNEGTAPVYQWKKNGVNILGANSNTYTGSGIAASDAITCQLTSNAACVINPSATSNTINFSMSSVPATTWRTNARC
jgi:hypothetical protein